MKKLIHFVLICVFVVSIFLLGGLIADKKQLQEKLIRMHIIANSDESIDQGNKLVVRDAVISFLDEHMKGITTMQQAKSFLQAHILEIEDVANSALGSVKAQYKATATLVEEAFSRRDYKTFSLPSGIYQSLKIELGEAEGKNWWCVAFPTLCIPTTNDEFQDMAVEAGFQEGVVATVSGENGYKIRFFILDCLGKVENFFHFS